MLKKGLNGNIIKILALIFMTVDHVGLVLFDNNVYMRIIGRIAFPLFFYMVAEGCFYTKNKFKHFGLIFGLGVLCQVVFYIFEKSFYLNILLTLSLSVLLIYTYSFMLKRKTFFSVLVFVLTLSCSFFLSWVLPKILNNTDFRFDYDFVGIICPLLVYLFKDRRLKLLFMAVGCLLLSLFSPLNDIQWWCFLSLIPIFFYDGSKGRLNIKYLFYIYYPLHLALIYGISFII